MTEKQPQEISSLKNRRRERKSPEIIKDPRFFRREVNPLYLANAYSFLYSKQEEELAERQRKGENVKKELERVEARKKLLYVKRAEKEARTQELERVKEGKKPFYLSRKHKKIIQTVYTAKEKGAEHVINRLKKKQKEKDNKSRGIYE